MLAINKNYPLVSIPKISQSLLRWQNAMANKCFSIDVSLGREALSYRISLLSTPILEDNVTFGILFEVDGVPFPVWFSAWPLEKRIKEFIADGDITRVPVDLRAELVERALSPLLEPLIQKTQVNIHVMNFLTHQPSEVNDMSLGFEFTDEFNNVTSLMVVVHEKVAPSILKMMDYWPSRPVHPWQNYITPLWLEVGGVDLSLRQLSQVKQMDVFLLEKSQDVDNNKVLLRNGAGGFYRAVLADKQLLIKSGIIIMSDDIQNEVLDNINDIPVRLTFDVGEITLPFNTVQKLADGAVIELNYPITPMVTIRSNNKVIGMGELVDIDGKKGVRISQLFAAVNKESTDG
jgi:type III secretion system YscQ/HrcQ family protein